ncbi:hypothetical protein Tco_0142669, partial [Tanacetum coccineum]
MGIHNQLRIQVGKFVISVDGMTCIILHGALKVDGLSWAVRLGRRGSTDSNATQAVEDLPR